jgi:hypothetical protein
MSKILILLILLLVGLKALMEPQRVKLQGALFLGKIIQERRRLTSTLS